MLVVAYPADLGFQANVRTDIGERARRSEQATLTVLSGFFAASRSGAARRGFPAFCPVQTVLLFEVKHQQRYVRIDNELACNAGIDQIFFNKRPLAG